MLNKFSIQTNKKQEIIDITNKIKDIVKDSKIQEGICVVYVMHATAGIIINENYDKYVCEDIINKLDELIPESGNYKHDRIDNNAHSHIKSTLIGPDRTLIINKGEIVLGTWQGIALAEFDGPRTRNIFVKIIKG